MLRDHAGAGKREAGDSGAQKAAASRINQSGLVPIFR